MSEPYPWWHMSTWDSPVDATRELMHQVQSMHTRGYIFRAVELRMEVDAFGKKERWHVFVRPFPLGTDFSSP